MTVCLPFSKIRFLTVNPRTGYILLGFIMFIIIYCYQEFYYLNDIGTVPVACLFHDIGIDLSDPAIVGHKSVDLFFHVADLSVDGAG